MEPRTKIQKDVMSIMTIEIDRSWTAYEFSELFNSINRLYDFYRLYDEITDTYEMHGAEFSWNDNLKNLPKIAELRHYFLRGAFEIFSKEKFYPGLPNELLFSGYIGFNTDKLEVRRIKFGSRGAIDFIGLGKIFEIIKDVIIHYIPNKEKKIDMDIPRKLTHQFHVKLTPQS